MFLLALRLHEEVPQRDTHAETDTALQSCLPNCEWIRDKPAAQKVRKAMLSSSDALSFMIAATILSYFLRTSTRSSERFRH
eukprot:839717-Amphidinium_carterae.1